MLIHGVKIRPTSHSSAGQNLLCLGKCSASCCMKGNESDTLCKLARGMIFNVTHYHHTTSLQDKETLLFLKPRLEKTASHDTDGAITSKMFDRRIRKQFGRLPATTALLAGLFL